MKSKEQKYQEAIERNMRRFESISKTRDEWSFVPPHSTLVRCLQEAKHKIGIRQEDSRYDDKIVFIIHTKTCLPIFFGGSEKI